jgi:hypothetical protein
VDPVVDLLAVDGDLATGLETEPDLVAPDADDGDDDIVVDEDLLVGFPR